VSHDEADLIEEVSRVVEMTRKEAEVIVEAIFDSIVRSLRGETRLRSAGSAVSHPAEAAPRGRNPKTGREWKFRPRKYLISNPVKS